MSGEPEKIVRGQLGVLIQDVTQDLAKQFGLPKPEGVLVSQVNKGSPAEKAGIRPGDVIVRYQGHDTKTVRELRNLIASTVPGTKASVVVVRGGKEQTLTATVGVQTAEKEGTTASQASASALSKLGIHAESLTPKMAKELGVEVSQGAVVTEVAEGSPASLAGLEKGDVIVEVDRRPVADVSALEQAVAKAKGQLLMRLVRRGGSLFVVISL
jgi:serine protease Do